MIVSWLVYVLLVSALVSVAAWLGERAARAQGWPVRWSWAGALAATVGFPAWAWLAPSSGSEGLAPLPGSYVMGVLPPLVLESGTSTGPGVVELLLVAWAVASAALLSWLGVAAVRLRAAERGWRAEELDGVRVLVSEATGPAAMGLIRGRVVLPQWALALDDRLRRLMVLHEAEHVRAGDPRLALAGLVVCALMPWNAVAWWQLRRLRLAIEMDCDARVLRRSDDVGGYGALLLEVGGRRSRLAVGLAETRTSLERRIRMITMRTTGRRTLRALGLAAVSGLVLAVACETPGPTEIVDPERRPVELEDVLVSGANGSLAADTLRLHADDVAACRPVVYLDGDEVPWDDIEGLIPDVVESISVLKGEASEHPCGTILIRTNGASPEARERAQRTDAAMQEARVRAARPSSEELAREPMFTPMHVRPQYRNVGEMQRLLADQYPPLLRNAGIGGTTNVWMFIETDGRVAKAVVNQGSGYDALDQAALRVAEAAEFTPAQLDGEPIPVWIALDITFER